jgi:hypothetical protein
VQPVDLERVREFIYGTEETLQTVSHLFLADYDEKERRPPAPPTGSPMCSSRWSCSRATDVLRLVPP